MPMVANFARKAFSSSTGGQNCKTKFRYFANGVFISSLVKAGKSIAGAAGGAGCFRNCDSGCTL